MRLFSNRKPEPLPTEKYYEELYQDACDEILKLEKKLRQLERSLDAYHEASRRNRQRAEEAEHKLLVVRESIGTLDETIQELSDDKDAVGELLMETTTKLMAHKLAAKVMRIRAAREAEEADEEKEDINEG